MSPNGTPAGPGTGSGGNDTATVTASPPPSSIPAQAVDGAGCLRNLVSAVQKDRARQLIERVYLLNERRDHGRRVPV